MNKNLKPFSKQSVDKARESGKKGGVASGKKRREQKAFKELLKIALMQDSPDFDGTNAEAIVAGLILAASAGDTKAFIAIRDTLGEKPVESVKTELAGGLAFAWGSKD